jgi:exopolysaccharide production protein ExoY
MASISVNYAPHINECGWAWQVIGVAERVMAALLLALLSPFLGLIWMTILALSGRSPLIAHRRVGQYGAVLWVLKFRTMWRDRSREGIRRPLSVEYIDDESGPARKASSDLRVASRFARFCRHHSLDELPQLIDVARGQMALVGPRPVTAPELEQLYGSGVIEILSVRPGISGLWQVSGRSLLTASERCALDLECVRQRSVRRYFSILMRTVPVVVLGIGAW